MKLILQRVSRGSVKVKDQIIGQINHGLVVLVGFTKTDNDKTIEKAVNKLLKIRLWKGLKEDDKHKPWQTNLIQFTLYSVLKGNKPDFHQALNSEMAIQLYEKMIVKLKEQYQEDKIQTGKFGELMQVEIINEGPVTIPIEY